MTYWSIAARADSARIRPRRDGAALLEVPAVDRNADVLLELTNLFRCPVRAAAGAASAPRSARSANSLRSPECMCRCSPTPESGRRAEGPNASARPPQLASGTNGRHALLRCEVPRTAPRAFSKIMAAIARSRSFGARASTRFERRARRAIEAPRSWRLAHYVRCESISRSAAPGSSLRRATHRGNHRSRQAECHAATPLLRAIIARFAGSRSLSTRSACSCVSGW